MASRSTRRRIFLRLVAIVALTVVVTTGLLVLEAAERSAETTCLSSVVTLARTTLMYATDYDDRMPPRDHWLDLVTSRPEFHEMDHCPLVSGPGLVGYAMNAGVKTANDPSPESTPLVYDSVNLARNAADLVTSLPLPGRHGGVNVIGYLDGHAKGVTNPPTSGGR